MSRRSVASLRHIALGVLAALVAAISVAVPSASAAGGGVISGTVRDAVTGAPIPDAHVAIHGVDNWSMGDETDENGKYSIDLGSAGRASGAYFLSVGQVNGPYKGFFPQDDSQNFTYTAGVSRSGMDIALKRISALSGSASGPVDMVTWCGSVEVIRSDTGEQAAFDFIGTHGTFWFDTSTLEAGRYSVKVKPCNYTGMPGGNYIETWLGGVQSLADAATVYINPGDEIALPTITLLEGSKISGTVAAATCQGTVWGTPTTFRGSVEAIDVHAPHRAFGVGGDVDATGNYVIDALPPGDYNVVFHPAAKKCGAEGGQQGQWWSGNAGAPAFTLAGAASVSLGIHGSVSHVNASLATAGSTISGVVKDSKGAPVEGVPISVTAADGSLLDAYGTAGWVNESRFGTLYSGKRVGPGIGGSATTYTGSDGSFEVPSVAAGTYDVYVGGGNDQLGRYDGDLASTFHDGAAFPENSVGVTVDGVHDPAPLRLSRVAGGSISGTLTPDSTVYIDPNMSHEVGVVAFAYNDTAGAWEPVADAMGEMNYSRHYTIKGLAAGTYKVGFYDWYEIDGFAPELYGETLDFDAAPVVTVVAGRETAGIDFDLSAVGPVDQQRYAGAGRFETSVAISRTFTPGVSVAYVASGENFPDALAAAPAAADAGGPLLITRSASLPAEVKAELQRLKPARIVVVGGAAAVSTAVYGELAKLAGAGGISRVSGADRYDTAREIVSEHWAATSVDRVYIASGKNFPDALSAAAAAGAQGVPVITVDGSAAHLDPDVAALIRSLGASEVAVAGGTSAVSAGIMTDLAAISGVTSAWRYAGSNRYSTGFAINHDAFSGSDLVYVASGNNFPDALSGAAIAGRDKAPLYIVPGTCVTKDVADDIRNLGATRVTVLGGPAVVSVELANVSICK